ncbi:MAG: asparaginase [Bacteroidetes Order II. Incertae sedis bacterium]|jgi:L-asparaginase|nr:asparaginase [Bacteroidetes Order II. bacterium]MBT6424270.1 asparaginase [Bacteroidetes Order II. bacterium]MBT6581832.1 asparaginase [Bacteroidetes Order II. bacterium]MBT6597938.1 asparaginase [Bacteroidetes Order II. bacterium]MBT7399871.1 asparaginase [Bacteroidetes Order II. bacterium]
MPLKIKIITTGGTIDKVYYDAKSDYQIGDPQVKAILDRVGATIEYEITDIFHKDSLDITDLDRQSVVEEVLRTEVEYIILTHGTDTMVETAKLLQNEVTGKTIILVGSLTPARFRETDAEFNIGVAVGAVQSLPHGIYVAMNGVVFDPSKVRKNRAENRFEPLA